MRVAIVHEWLETYAGSERVVEQILQCYPKADLFALVDFLPPEQRGFIQNKQVQISFLQYMSFAKARFRHYWLLMKLVMEQFDLPDYDLMISSLHAIDEGALIRLGKSRISYAHEALLKTCCVRAQMAIQIVG